MKLYKIFEAVNESMNFKELKKLLKSKVKITDDFNIWGERGNVYIDFDTNSWTGAGSTGVYSATHFSKKNLKQLHPLTAKIGSFLLKNYGYSENDWGTL